MGGAPHGVGQELYNPVGGLRSRAPHGVGQELHNPVGGVISCTNPWGWSEAVKLDDVDEGREGEDDREHLRAVQPGPLGACLVLHPRQRRDDKG